MFSTFVQRGITAAVIQTPVELLLRQNGIPVLNHGDSGLSDGNPVLYESHHLTTHGRG